MKLDVLKDLLNLMGEKEIIYKKIKDLEVKIVNKEGMINKKNNSYTKQQIPFYHRLFKSRKYKVIVDEHKKEIKQLENEIVEDKELKKILSDQLLEIEKRLEEFLINYPKEMSFIENSKNIGINSDGFLEINDNNEKLANDYTNQKIVDDLSIDDFVLVHATSYFPDNYVIKTLNEKKVPVFPGGVESLSVRKTIHFSVNGKVSSHSVGNWDNCPIVILDPLKKHVDQLACIWSNDSYSYGSVKISDEAVMLISKNYFDRIYSEHKEEIDSKKERIIVFDGDSTVAVENILILLGYKPQNSNNFDWINSENGQKFSEFVVKNFPNKIHSSHKFTKHKMLEDTLLQRNVALGTYRNEINDYFNGEIITLEELYVLFESFFHYCKIDVEIDKIRIARFIKNYGIYCHDNEIHLLGYKEIVDNYEKEVSLNQIMKVQLLLKKYMISNELNEKGSSRGK